MAINDTFFTNDTGSASSSSDYIKDVFDDVTLPASSNSGLTSTALTNPLGDLYANDDTPKFSVKTLYIKDLVLIQDRSKWVSNKPTYRVIFTESYPGVSAYWFGNFVKGELNYQIDPQTEIQYTLQSQNVGDGFGVTGTFRKAAFLVQPTSTATASAQMLIDGVNTQTATFGGGSTTEDAVKNPAKAMFINATANQTKDIHDYRITASQATTLNVIGVAVYFENTGFNVDIYGGTTYVNKTKVQSSGIATLSIPSMGSSLGGNALIYKTTASGYATSGKGVSLLTSIAQGTTGTNILNVSTGHGGSFPIGTGLLVANGTSMYIGSVLSVSTDALTVGPTLTFGISSTIQRAWVTAPTLAINASLSQLDYTVNAVDYLRSTLSVPMMDLKNRWAINMANVGFTVNDGVGVAFFKGGSGFFKVEGRFNAADYVTYGQTGHIHATITVNGTVAYSLYEGATGYIKKTVFDKAGAGWNQFMITAGASCTPFGFAQFNLYNTARDQGVTFGGLANIVVNQAYTERLSNNINATMHALGTYERVSADKLYLSGDWVRTTGITYPQGLAYIGASTNSVARFQYYGKNYGIHGTPGASAVLQLDTVSVGVTVGFMQIASTEMFHDVIYTHKSGTSIISAIDFTRTYGELMNEQKLPTSIIPKSSSLSLENRIVIQDQKAANTSGGTVTVGSYQTATLNTVYNPNSVTWFALASNVLTLLPGFYEVRGWKIFRACDRCKIKLQNTSDALAAVIGGSEYADNSNATQVQSELVGNIDVQGVPKTFELQYQAQTATTIRDMGTESNFTVAELYASLEIIKKR